MIMMSRRCCSQRLTKRPYFYATAAMAATSSSCMSSASLALAFSQPHASDVAHRRHVPAHHLAGICSPITTCRSTSAMATSTKSRMPSAVGHFLSDVHWSRRFSHASIDGESDDTSNLETRLRLAYEAGDTDGIMEMFSSSATLLRDTSAETLVQASIDASGGRSGMAASILNGLLGSCVVLSDEDQLGAQKAIELMVEWEEISKEQQVRPDLVSYCLAYSALHPIVEADAFFADFAKDMLERARRLAKKVGGTKYRKANAKARRKGNDSTVAYARDTIAALQERYGVDFNILHEDDHILVVSKPSGMVCYHQRKTTAGKVGRKKRAKGAKDNASADADVSLTDALVEDVNMRLSTLNPNAAGIVHRIDRGTSGCITLAKTDEAHALLVAEFFTRGAKKTYEALVPARPVQIRNRKEGLDPLPDSGDIDLPINDKSARSAYKIVQRFGDDAMRIRVETFTGRKHQVRRHAAEGLSRPLFLDAMYWDSKNLRTEDLPDAIAQLSDESSRKDETERFFLHASSLRIPSLGIDVEAPLPLWWQKVEKELL
jgi:23S rRNA-/tRNA-specific pseudouridylate synthase